MYDIADCLLALAAGRHGAALAHARAITGRSPSLLAHAFVRALERDRADVWADDGAAFRRFVDGGDNVELYRATGEALAAVHGRDEPATVLDLGCGDGRLTAAALGSGVDRLDLVDPSAERLAAAVARLDGRAATVVSHRLGAVELLRDPEVHGGTGWDLAQSTWALDTLSPEDRREVLAGLARSTRRLLVVEFDLPPFADRSVEHARYAAERYEAGVTEYDDDDQVVDGFLMPVLIAQFEPGAPRASWEQPAEAWADDLRAAGFTAVEHRRIADYWWAPAHLIEATGAG